MDYTEAELEARIFPSVDIDPMDLTDEQLDEQFGNESYFEDPWSEAWMDANTLESAGMGEDDGCSDID